MNKNNYITAFCSIKSGVVNINHSIVYAAVTPTPSAIFLKSIYKHYQLNYPKFYKMDNLCKLGYLASELLLKSNTLTEHNSKNDIGIIIANSCSSLETDTEHQKTIDNKKNYFPSPALFVYTLPNILIGEISIRNNIKGENTFFIFKKFDADFMSNYVNSLLNSNKINCCIAGWVDYYDETYNAFLYTVEKQKKILPTNHTKEELEKLFI